jgi:integrase
MTTFGPYKHRNRWRVLDSGKYFSFSSKEEAEKYACFRAENNKTIIEDLISLYVEHKKNKGLKFKTYEETRRRLTLFFSFLLKKQIVDVTVDMGQFLYGKLQKLSVSTHRSVLSEARSFMSWCAARGIIKENPLKSVEGLGKRNRGKTQLRLDEARKWLATCFESGEPGLAASMTLLLGLRCSEIVGLKVKDLDDSGKILWITESKTEKGKRILEVPEVLQGRLTKQAIGKSPEDLLFGKKCRHWVHYWVRKICKKAGVTSVCAHAMRGAHATFATQVGVTGPLVAEALGHTNCKVTYQHYVTPGTISNLETTAVTERLLN